jgi:formylglycine-generating enzyme required for sulfatase activity
VYEGDGGVGIRLAVLAPEARGDVPGYLPLYIQGLLNNNFKKYSAVTLIDRQNLNQIISEQDIGTSGRYSDRDFVSIGNLTNTQYFLFGSVQKLSGERYSLQLSITDSSTGVRRADFMKDGLLSQIEGNGTLINEASADLLSQMGVRLTETGRRTLLAGNVSAVQSAAGLARGITAQAAGSEVEALFNFSQSVAFDPSQMEALSRLSTLSSGISGGTISQRIVSDIQARNRWLEVFKETARFFQEHPPFEITFDPNLVQEGLTDYVRNTANIAMRIALDPSEAGFGALNALLEGLEKTGKRGDWGFSGWPLLDISPRTAGTVVFEGKRWFSFKVDAVLINESGKTIGRGSITLNSGNMNFSAGDKTVFRPDGAVELIRFPNVKAGDLTPTLTIVITAVNGIPSARLNASGYMRIDAGDLEGKVQSISESFLRDFVRINGGTFTMGSPAGESHRDSNEVRHQVTVSSFYMGKYEVTQKEWYEVMGTTVRQQRDKANPEWSMDGEGDNYPMYYVDWYEAIEYCNRRSQREGLTLAYTVNGTNVTWNRSANGYRLPTEAEWEYVCRAGTATAYNTGARISDTTGWYNFNSRTATHPVGQKPANRWGLYDMHGNVREWCWDLYGSYASGAQAEPTGASSGFLRVLRGGSWISSGGGLRSAYRYGSVPSFRYSDIGFRLLRP